MCGTTENVMRTSEIYTGTCPGQVVENRIGTELPLFPKPRLHRTLPTELIYNVLTVLYMYMCLYMYILKFYSKTVCILVLKDLYTFFATKFFRDRRDQRRIGSGRIQIDRERGDFRNMRDRYDRDDRDRRFERDKIFVSRRDMDERVCCFSLTRS